jgi:hypothetical protein
VRVEEEEKNCMNEKYVLCCDSKNKKHYLSRKCAKQKWKHQEREEIRIMTKKISHIKETE